MPIFIPKTISYTPESLKKFEPIEDDPQDFIQDPEQFIDTLPQPYRMLNKVLYSILDHAWEVITSRDEERMVEASKIKPPKYFTDIQIEVHGPCKSICSSPKGDVIFMGKPDGLVALTAETQEPLDEWKDPKMDIVHVEAVQAEDSNCLVCTIDDLGIGRLFLYSEKTLYFMFAFNEPSQPSQFQVSKPAQKPIITMCEPSSNGDYVAICFENVQNQENWLDVFKINKETLLKELDSANNRYAKKDNPAAQEIVEPKEGEETGEGGPPVEGQTAEPEDRADSPFSSKSQPDKRSARFTAPQLVLKVRPQQPLTPNNFASPLAAQNSVDASGEVLGSGLKHQLSAHHLGMSAAVFEYLHDPQQASKVPTIPEKIPTRMPTVHFIHPGRLVPTGLDQPNMPVSVLVWWEDQCQVCFYPLTKQAKAQKSGRTRATMASPVATTPAVQDVEHKPDIVWPVSEPLVYSALSQDGSLLALGLKNNNVTIWDLHLGMPRKTVHISDTGKFFKLQFLNPNIHTETSTTSPLSHQKPYKLATNCYLLVLLDDGQNYVVSCGLNDRTSPKQTSKVLKDWEKYTIFEPLQALPELAVTMRKNGQAFVEDITSGEILLAIEMPPPFKMFMPWQPVFAVGGGGSMLFIRGHHVPTNKNVIETRAGDPDLQPDVNSLFVFKLRSYRTLDKYRKRERRADNSYVVQALLKERVNALLQDRISEQTGRQARMQERWTQLKEELELIREFRDRSFNHSAPKSAFSESTIARTPALELQRHMGDAC